jgi:8-oxo-dGTP pyrophosphatase MutT (NUDIX family)
MPMPFHAQLPLWDDKSSEQKIETMRAMLDDLYAYVLAESREKLRQILQEASPADEKEKADIATMLALLEKHPNIMAQNCEVGHFTASALVVDKTGRVLLHYHKNLQRWLQFGGHADYESDFAVVALREGIEETGLPDLRHVDSRPLDFDVHPIPQSGERPPHLHLDIRYMLLTEQPEALNVPPEESQTLTWASFEEWLNPDSPYALEYSLKRLLGKGKAVFESQA